MNKKMMSAFNKLITNSKDVKVLKDLIIKEIELETNGIYINIETQNRVLKNKRNKFEKLICNLYRIEKNNIWNYKIYNIKKKDDTYIYREYNYKF